MNWMRSSPRASAGEGVLRFGAFELDVRTRELRKSGGRLSLQDQPLQVLIALLEKRGQLVTRDELRRRLWPADTFVDFEHGVNAAVKRLRDGLGDSAEAPRFVETVPRRGYRFIAAVNEPLPAWRRRPLGAIAYVVTAVLSVAAIAYALYR